MCHILYFIEFMGKEIAVSKNRFESCPNNLRCAMPEILLFHIIGRPTNSTFINLQFVFMNWRLSYNAEASCSSAKMTV